MADLTVPVATDRAFSGAERAGRGNEPIWDVIELLFFAYRDFIGDPDDVLAKLGFGRAHHRVLHFVNRNPGMKVAELLDVLKITKQSLGRVLKQKEKDLKRDALYLQNPTATAQPARTQVNLVALAEPDRLLQSDGVGGHRTPPR